MALAGRPGHAPAAQHVQVEVVDGLAGPPADVGDQPVGAGHAVLAGDLVDGRDQAGQQLPAVLGDRLQAGHVLLGMTRTWVGAWGLTSRKASTSSRSRTTWATTSLLTILQNRQSGSLTRRFPPSLRCRRERLARAPPGRPGRGRRGSGP